MIDLHVILGLLAALAVSLALSLVLAWTRATRALAGAAALVAYAAGHAVMAGWPAFPPANVIQWPVWLALGSAVALAIAAFLDLGRIPFARIAAIAIASFAGPWLILRQLAHVPEIQAHLALWIAIAGGATCVAALLWERACASWRPFTVHAILAAVMGANVVAMMLAGSFELGQRAAVLAAAVGAPLAVSWWRGSAATSPAVAAIAISWLWLLAYALWNVVELSPAVALIPSWALVAIAPAAAWLLRPLAARRPRTAAALAIIVALLVAGSAVAWIWFFGQPPERDHSYE